MAPAFNQDILVAETVNFDTLAQALAEAPDLTKKFVHKEMTRFGKRFRKTFLKDRLRGRPGILWQGGLKKIGDLDASVGRNVRAFGTGQSLQDLRFVTKISRFLGYHETGITAHNVAIRLRPGLSPRPGDVQGLFLLGRTSTLAVREPSLRSLYLLRQTVTVPARLGFEPMAKTQITADLVPKIEAAMGRALQKAADDRVKAITGTILRVAHA